MKTSTSSLLLTVLFIGLKLTNCITWSWWFVLMPLYIPLICGAIILFSIILISKDKDKIIDDIMKKLNK